MGKENYQILNEQEKFEQYADKEAIRSPFDVGIPLLDISDKTIEAIYYFRWHTFCKHLKETPKGYVITEFLPQVPWSGIYNTISCPAGHHFYEGRWLHDQQYLNSYARFWFTEEASPRLYSFWAADAIMAACEISGNYELAEELYEDLKKNYAAWEKENKLENGLFYQIDDRDGMEYSVGGSGARPTINSYMYGDAIALSKIATRLGLAKEAAEYASAASEIKQKMDVMLWDEEACFYKTLAENKNYEKADVRELIGYVPWYFNLPDEDKSEAWKFLNDPHYFYAPYGPTTAEQNHERFMEQHPHECLWNGPSWPFATSQTLTALSNLLCHYHQTVMEKSDYYRLLKQYAGCHYLTENGKKIPFIDENIDPFTGEWLTRKILKSMSDTPMIPERGKDYNHSTFCDLVLCGLAGIRPGQDNILEVNPLFSPSDLEYLCADAIRYHGHNICVLWDRTGERYHLGNGFKVFCDGQEVYTAKVPEKALINLK